MSSQEVSKKDRMIDRRAARKAKMSQRSYENSPLDTDAPSAPQTMKSGGAVRGMGAAKRGGRYTVS